MENVRYLRRAASETLWSYDSPCQQVRSSRSQYLLSTIDSERPPARRTASQSVRLSFDDSGIHILADSTTCDPRIQVSPKRIRSEVVARPALRDITDGSPNASPSPSPAWKKHKHGAPGLRGGDTSHGGGAIRHAKRYPSGLRANHVAMRVDTTEYLKNKVNPGTVDVFCGAQTQSINSQASSTPSSNTVSGPMERSFYLGGKRICSSTTRKKQELEETEHLRRPGAAFEQADECQTRKDPRVKDFAWTAMSTALADIQFAPRKGRATRNTSFRRQSSPLVLTQALDVDNQTSFPTSSFEPVLPEGLETTFPSKQTRWPSDWLAKDTVILADGTVCRPHRSCPSDSWIIEPPSPTTVELMMPPSPMFYNPVEEAGNTDPSRSCSLNMTPVAGTETSYASELIET